MRRLLGHKWAVGGAALLLVFALGAVSWAAADDTTTPAASGDAVAPGGPGFGMFGPGDGLEGEFAHMGGRMRGGMLDGMRDGMRGGLMTDEMKAQIEEHRAAREAQRDAFLKLVRDKMTPEEQASLDRLLRTAETQREALDQARDALHGTTSQIRDLIAKYFPLDGADSADGGTNPTTAPAADGAGL